MESPDHGETAQHPPAVANIFPLLGPTVETTIIKLSLTKPLAQPVPIDEIKPTGDGKGADTCEHLARMGLGAGT